jgi:putative sigma-54 modulation protein
MHLELRGKNIDLTPAISDYVTRKLGKLDRYFGEIEAQVALSVEKGRHIVEVTIPIDGLLLRGEESSASLYASVDLVLDKLERQIHKYKTRVNRRMRRDDSATPPQAARGIETVPGGAGVGAGRDESDEEFQVVRLKRFPFKPMTVDEAILQMNLLGHDFFVFVDADDEQVGVVYRRRDGSYGLIAPGA